MGTNVILFSWQIRPDSGNTAQADTAGLGSIEFKILIFTLSTSSNYLDV